MNDKAAKRSGAAMISVIVLSVLLLGVSFILGRGASSSVSDLYAANLPVRLAYFTLSVLMTRWVIDDIFIASIPGKYIKAFNKAVKIKARYSFLQRLTQCYIREHLP